MRSVATLSIFYFLSTLAFASAATKPAAQQQAVVGSKGATNNASVPAAGNSKLSAVSNVTVVADKEVSGVAIVGRTAKLVGVKSAYAPAGYALLPAGNSTIKNTKGSNAFIDMEYLSIQAPYHKTFAIDFGLVPVGKGKHTPGGPVSLVKKYMHLDKESKTSPNSVTKRISLTSDTCGVYSESTAI